MKNMNESLRKALDRPLGFPSLEQTFFSGDRILFVPDAEFASDFETLLEIVDAFLDHGIRAEDLSILLTEPEEKTALRELRPRLRPEIGLFFHRPSQRERLALLGVNADDEPIALCRELVDADMVVSIGRYNPKSSGDHFGLHTAIFPRFSDQETQARFSQAKGTARRKRNEEVREVAKQLGVVFTIQFHQRRGSSVQVAAGRPEAVEKSFQL